MNQMLFPEDVANVVQSFVLVNKDDKAIVALILSVGAELLDITVEEMEAMIQ